jgi:signal peptidase II
MGMAIPEQKTRCPITRCIRSPMTHASLWAVFILVIDQISKWWLITRVLDHQAIGFWNWFTSSAPQIRLPHIPVTDFFNLVMVWNRGISFGMLQQDHQMMPYILSALGLAVTIGFLIWVRHSTSRWMTYGVGLVMGGAIGNIWDRLRFGAVADFFDFYIGAYHWPAFNVADSAIFVGVILLLIHVMLEKPASRVES